MTTSESTCWTMIRGAAAGDPRQRACFATRYIAAVRAYLAARWRSTLHCGEIDDAIQEVFVECFRKGGVLDRVEPDYGGGFRPYLFGVVRNVALRFEGREGRMRVRHPPGSPNPDKIVRSDRGLSWLFDRAWVAQLVREAARLQTAQAMLLGQDALRRVDLLHLRFHENLPVREIAHLWALEPAVVHRQYQRARQEFKVALMEVLARHYGDCPVPVKQRCEDLLAVFD